MKNTLLLVATLLLMADMQAQQIYRRTQFPFNTYLVNPATAGTQLYSPIMASYRNQWAGWDHAPKTMTLSGHTALPKNIGVGGIAFNDDTGGAIARTGLELTGAYKIDLNNVDAVSFGLSGMISQYKFDNSKLVVYDESDLALVPFESEKHMNLDATFGFLVYGPQYFFGFSIPQLIQSKLKLDSGVSPDDNRNSRHFLFMGSYKYILDDYWDLQPAALVKFTGNTPVQLDVHLKANYADLFWAGLSFRAKDALAIMVGGQFYNMTLNYSYDLTTSNAATFSPHTHEISLGYLIPRKNARFVNKSLLGPRILERSRIVN